MEFRRRNIFEYSLDKISTVESTLQSFAHDCFITMQSVGLGTHFMNPSNESHLKFKRFVKNRVLCYFYKKDIQEVESTIFKKICNFELNNSRPYNSLAICSSLSKNMTSPERNLLINCLAGATFSGKAACPYVRKFRGGNCPLCKADESDLFHYFFDCKILRADRIAIFQSFDPERYSNSPDSRLKFLIRCFGGLQNHT